MKTKQFTTPEAQAQILLEAKKLTGTINHISGILCKQFGCSRGTIAGVLKTTRKAQLRVAMSDHEKRDILDMYNSKELAHVQYKMSHIAKVTGRSIVSVRRVINGKKVSAPEKMFNYKSPIF